MLWKQFWPVSLLRHFAFKYKCNKPSVDKSMKLKLGYMQIKVDNGFYYVCTFACVQNKNY